MNQIRDASFIVGDCTDDNRVSLADLQCLMDYLAGPISPPPQGLGECIVSDFEGDYDVDLADTSGFQTALRGE